MIGGVIVVFAVGAARANDVGHVAKRLGGLASGGPSRVRINCSRVTAIDCEVVAVLSTAASALAHRGGSIQFVDVPEGLGF